MAISYNGLWKILIDNGMKKGDLKRRTGISSGTIAKMTNGEAVTLTVLEKICNELNCDIGDLVEIDTFNENINEYISDIIVEQIGRAHV